MLNNLVTYTSGPGRVTCGGSQKLLLTYVEKVLSCNWVRIRRKSLNNC